MARQPDGPPPPPVVQRLRIRYAKRGRLRFTSHRDVARAFERALRRAAVPMAYSAGFTPHPKVSYAGASPTGVASEAEYLEIGLAEIRDPQEIGLAIDAALPPGLDIVEVVEAAAPALGERLDASHWRIELAGVTVEHAQAAVEAFLAAETALVERVVKDGRRVVDARAVIVTMSVSASTDEHGDAACAILDLVVRHVTPAVRPDDVLTALRRLGPLSTPVTPVVTRLAQGRLDATAPSTDPPDGGALDATAVRLIDPLGPDVVAPPH